MRIRTRSLVSVLCLVVAQSALAQGTTFCDGFEEGWKAIRGELATVPICPVAPVTPVGSTPYREGLKTGMRAGEPIRQFGVAVSVVPSTSFLISIRPSKALILEPELGLRQSTTTNNIDSSKFKSSVTTLGVGLLFRGKERDNLEPYVGPRVGIQRTRLVQDGTSSPKQTITQSDWYFTAAVGAHYFFSRHLTLGAEVQFTKFSEGDQKLTPPDPSYFNFKTSRLGTAGVWILRWYF